MTFTNDLKRIALGTLGTGTLVTTLIIGTYYLTTPTEEKVFGAQEYSCKYTIQRYTDVKTIEATQGDRQATQIFRDKTTQLEVTNNMTLEDGIAAIKACEKAHEHGESSEE